MLGVLGCPNLPQRRIEEGDGDPAGTSSGGCLFTGVRAGHACVGSLWTDELPTQVYISHGESSNIMFSE